MDGDFVEFALEFSLLFSRDEGPFVVGHGRGVVGVFF